MFFSIPESFSITKGDPPSFSRRFSQQGRLIPDQIIDHVLRDICGILPGSPDTLRDVPERDGIGSLLLDDKAVDLPAQGFEHLHGLNVLIRLFQVVIEK